MANFCLLLVVVLVAGVSSQSYPRFEFRGTILRNDSFVFRGSIGEGQGTSLHCVSLSVILRLVFPSNHRNVHIHDSLMHANTCATACSRGSVTVSHSI